jgi:hypothetical protein
MIAPDAQQVGGMGSFEHHFLTRRRVLDLGKVCDSSIISSLRKALRRSLQVAHPMRLEG